MLPIDVIRIADAKASAFGIPSANLAAIIDVESNGKIFATVDGEKRPIILFERHILYRRTSGAARDALVKRKLAAKKPGGYPKTQAARWQQIADAQQILIDHGQDDTPAFESASYGVGQVLGLHWKALGFASFDDFYATMRSGAEGQIDIMLKYVVANDLLDELQQGRWAGFFRGYNGPAYKKGGYHIKVKAALKLYGGESARPDGMLRLGSKGARVRELQTLLVRAGHSVKVDGDFGPATKKALRAFQQANGISVDGIYGPETESALGTYRQVGERTDPKPTEVREVVEGIGGAGGSVITIEAVKAAIDGAKDEVIATGVSLPIVDYLVAGLGVLAAVLAMAGLAYAAWGWWKSKRTKEA